MIVLYKQNNIIDKNKCLGIELLRMILCFWVVSYHYLRASKINYLLLYITKHNFFHVPCFAFISFFFSYNIFFDRNILKFKKRLERLLIPYIIWPVIFLIINNILNRSNSIHFYELLLQLLLGRQFLIPHWYLFSIIFLSILLFILSILLKNYFLYVIQILFFVSYMIQYSNYYEFLYIYKSNLRLPLINTITLLPLSMSAIIFAYSEIIEALKIYKTNSIFFSFICIYALLKYNIFVKIGTYAGIINIFASLFLFIGFYLLPLYSLPLQCQKLIKQITSYTNGIYCLHSKMFLIVNINGTLNSIFKLYIISYFFSFLGEKLTRKTKLKYLFI